MAIMLIVTTVTFMLGGWWLWAGFLGAIGLYMVGDAIMPEDRSEPSYGVPFILNLALYSVLPLLFVMNGVLVWLAGTGDALGLGAFVQHHFSIDLFAARAATDHWAMWVGGILSAGLMTATGGTNVGHELTHRTRSAFDVFVGRWMLAFTCDVSFAIEHVYGHHVNVATVGDPATAKRGESVYPFVVRSTVGSYAHAWKLERERLVKQGKSVWNPLASRMMRGNLMSLLLFVGAHYLGGWMGVLIFAGVAAWGKSLLEITNYFEHYGLVRDPARQVEPRHSWNSNKMMSSAVLFSLTRHSHHHAEADVEFWKLRAYPEAPTLPYGYITTILIALVPPLFEHMMVPLLRDWDRRYATSAERALAAEQNRNSGIRALQVVAA